MRTLDYIQIDEKQVSSVISSLQQLLADFQVYYTNLRGFHWNVKGKGFLMLHERFEQMYNDAAEKADEIAERILTLGGVAENKFSEYLKVASIEEISGVSCGQEALKKVVENLSILMKEERLIIEEAGKIGDEVTVAIMSDYLKEQEKLVWMIVASSSVECAK